MKKIIGITGGIASGKSTVTDFLRQQGYQVVDADELVHRLQMPGGRLYQALLEHFGQDILLGNGQLDRAKLGQKIFSDEKERSWSSQVQGQIIREELAFEKDKLAQQEALFFMDIPLLFESHYEDWFDAVWLVDVTYEVQLERLMKRNNYSVEEASQRISSQWPSEKKKSLASLVIDNNSSVEQTLYQVRSALQTVCD